MYERFLRAIPPSNQPAQPIEQLVGRENAQAATGFAHALQLWGLVSLEQGLIRATSQTAHYALLSLAEWMASDQTIINDWETRGLRPEVLANGASFLHALEAHRLARMPAAPPTRHEEVAQVLVKRLDPITQTPQLLFQFDHNAQRYQLIGGRFSPARDANLDDTIQREIAEEILGGLRFGRDYQLRKLASGIQVPPMLSPTFGALTAYTFDFYLMVGLKQPLRLGEHDRWVNLDEALADVGSSNGEPHLLQLLAARIGSLHNLENSFALSP